MTYVSDENGCDIRVRHVSIVDFALLAAQSSGRFTAESPSTCLSLHNASTFEKINLTVALGDDGVFHSLETGKVLDLGPLAQTHHTMI